MPLETTSLKLLQEALDHLQAGFTDLPEAPPTTDPEAIASILHEVAHRMRDNYPYFHPLYAGQMLKPPHPIARLAYMLALWINPNNHALDGGRASSAMEKEAVAQLARMFGWQTHLGHLCGGGTMANMEALWVAGRLRPKQKVVASRQAHYTHERLCSVLRLPFESIPCDANGRMDMEALETTLAAGNVGTVVATMGTTPTGAVDPLPRIRELQTQYHFRLHADAAYGGFFILADQLAPETTAAFNALRHVDSLVVDPHKHGLQPYGCGCVLFRDPEVGTFYKHDSPYTYFSSDDLHLGEISLECSRAGASAVALWATLRLLPLERNGRFARDLTQCRRATLALYERLQADSRFLPPLPPELDILVWAPSAATSDRISDQSRRLFETAARRNLHLAVAQMPRILFEQRWPEVYWDQHQVTCLRSCLMKPEHASWVATIHQILGDALGDP